MMATSPKARVHVDEDDGAARRADEGGGQVGGYRRLADPSLGAEDGDYGAARRRFRTLAGGAHAPPLLLLHDAVDGPREVLGLDGLD